ncbi:MAG: aminoacyl-tRNA hydrolase [Bacteroidetes bacterium]|nr:MAG: aminoacyl-tRNA hydrolase [Bacteroidota bacterium]TAG87643.1 MAG: aminoacyl-tRNA hydrolase [Bacteroidota bacterium]
MKYLIVGLGNPGLEYELTRHNIGFLVLDQLAEKFETTFQTARLCEKSEIKYKGRTLHLIKPNTFMNLSGKAVNYWLQELDIPKENLLVIVDDLAIDHAKIRLKSKGSAGGHNGLTSIEQLIGTQEYARLRFGIGNDYAKGQQADYVLSNFSEEQMKDIITPINKAVEVVLSFVTIGIDKTMNMANKD